MTDGAVLLIEGGAGAGLGLGKAGLLELLRQRGGSTGGCKQQRHAQKPFPDAWIIHAIISYYQLPADYCSGSCSRPDRSI